MKQNKNITSSVHGGWTSGVSGAFAQSRVMMASQQGQGHVVTLRLSMVATFAPEEILIPTCVLDHIVLVLIFQTIQENYLCSQ